MRVSRNNQNVMRDVLAFLLRHWRREAWLVTGVACSMVVATIADLFMPVFAGRMVDAIAMHAGTHRAGVARRLVGVGHHAVVGRHSGRRTPPIADGHQPAHHTVDGAPGQRCVLSCAAVLDRLARQQLCRLDRPSCHPRHVGGGPDGRHAAAGLAAGIAGAGRQCAAARLALAVDGPDRGHGRDPLCRPFHRAIAELRVARGAAVERARHAGGRLPGRCRDLQRGGQVLRSRGA